MITIDQFFDQNDAIYNTLVNRTDQFDSSAVFDNVFDRTFFTNGYDDVGLEITSITSTRLEGFNEQDSDFEAVALGSGFQIVGDTPISGTLTAIELYFDGDLVGQLTGLAVSLVEFATALEEEVIIEEPGPGEGLFRIIDDNDFVFDASTTDGGVLYPNGFPNDDEFIGGSGPDTFGGGPGDDLLRGGAGFDTYLFSDEEGPFGNDVVVDPDDTGRIEFQGYSSAQALASDDGGDLLIGVAFSNSLRFEDYFSDGKDYDIFFDDGQLFLNADDGIDADSDYDGDNTSDVLFFDPGTRTVGLWTMDDANPSYSRVATLAGGFEVVGNGDFDADGADEVALYDAGSGQFGYWSIDGGVDWTGLGFGSGAYRFEGVGDFDGDDIDDVLWRNENNGQLGFWNVDGTGGWSWTGMNRPALEWNVEGIGDFDGDQTDDILFRNETSGAVGYYEMDNGVPSWQRLTDQSGLNWEIAGVGDFDGDGQDDIAFVDAAAGSVGQYVVDQGASTWEFVTTAGPGWDFVGTGDYDGDGVDDFLWQNGGGAVGRHDLSGGGAVWDPIAQAGGFEAVGDADPEFLAG